MGIISCFWLDAMLLMLMDDYSPVSLYNKQQNKCKVSCFCGQADTRENKKQDQYDVMSLLNQCNVLNKDPLIAPLFSVSASAISTS